MHIAHYTLPAPAIALAPMAGITDKPFRRLARRFGADWTVGEMISSDASLRHTRKTLHRSDRSGEEGVIAVQIAGSRPEEMAAAARYNVEQGAQLIDINMGCPAKKVCNVLAGSALLQNEPLVEAILKAVVAAVDVPVTLKTRLGWDENHKNLPRIAQMAEQAGIAALAVHGRTRSQMYRGQAEYALIAEVKRRTSLPLWVNGDITSPQKAAAVLAQTGADGVMVGRAAQGQPWLFADIRHYLTHGSLPPPQAFQAAAATALEHIRRHTVRHAGAVFRRTRAANGILAAQLLAGVLPTFQAAFDGQGSLKPICPTKLSGCLQSSLKRKSLAAAGGILHNRRSP